MQVEMDDTNLFINKSYKILVPIAAKHLFILYVKFGPLFYILSERLVKKYLHAKVDTTLIYKC